MFFAPTHDNLNVQYIHKLGDNVQRELLDSLLKKSVFWAICTAQQLIYWLLKYILFWNHDFHRKHRMYTIVIPFLTHSSLALYYHSVASFSHQMFKGITDETKEPVHCYYCVDFVVAMHRVSNLTDWGNCPFVNLIIDFIFIDTMNWERGRK